MKDPPYRVGSFVVEKLSEKPAHDFSDSFWGENA